MNQKHEYKIVEGGSHYDLQERVKKYLESGWYLVGGVAVYFGGDGLHFIQAVAWSGPQ